MINGRKKWFLSEIIQKVFPFCRCCLSAKRLNQSRYQNTHTHTQIHTDAVTRTRAKTLLHGHVHAQCPNENDKSEGLEGLKGWRSEDGKIHILFVFNAFIYIDTRPVKKYQLKICQPRSCNRLFPTNPSGAPAQSPDNPLRAAGAGRQSDPSRNLKTQGKFL